MALVLHRRELLPRKHVQRPRRDHDQQGGRDDRPAHLQRDVEQPRVRPAHELEAAVHQGGQPALLAVRVHEARAHHGRERDGDDARHHDRGGERERELQEQRSGQAALKADGRVDHGQRDRHRDDRAEQLARSDQRRVEPRLASAHVALDVFDDDDGVIDDQADGQHEGEDRQEIEAEAEREHDDPRADQRDGHRDQRH